MSLAFPGQLFKHLFSLTVDGILVCHDILHANPAVCAHLSMRDLVRRRLYRTPTWLDFPDMAMASLSSAHPAGRHLLYLDWRR